MGLSMSYVSTNPDAKTALAGQANKETSAAVQKAESFLKGDASTLSENEKKILHDLGYQGLQSDTYYRTLYQNILAQERKPLVEKSQKSFADFALGTPEAEAEAKSLVAAYSKTPAIETTTGKAVQGVPDRAALAVSLAKEFYPSYVNQQTARGWGIYQTEESLSQLIYAQLSNDWNFEQALSGNLYLGDVGNIGGSKSVQQYKDFLSEQKTTQQKLAQLEAEQARAEEAARKAAEEAAARKAAEEAEARKKQEEKPLAFLASNESAKQAEKALKEHTVSQAETTAYLDRITGQESAPAVKAKLQTESMKESLKIDPEKDLMKQAEQKLMGEAFTQTVKEAQKEALSTGKPVTVTAEKMQEKAAELTAPGGKFEAGVPVVDKKAQSDYLSEVNNLLKEGYAPEVKDGKLQFTKEVLAKDLNQGAADSVILTPRPGAVGIAEGYGPLGEFEQVIASKDTSGKEVDIVKLETRKGQPSGVLEISKVEIKQPKRPPQGEDSSLVKSVPEPTEGPFGFLVDAGKGAMAVGENLANTVYSSGVILSKAPFLLNPATYDQARYEMDYEMARLQERYKSEPEGDLIGLGIQAAIDYSTTGKTDVSIKDLDKIRQNIYDNPSYALGALTASAATYLIGLGSTKAIAKTAGKARTSVTGLFDASRKAEAELAAGVKSASLDIVRIEPSGIKTNRPFLRSTIQELAPIKQEIAAAERFRAETGLPIFEFDVKLARVTQVRPGEKIPGGAINPRTGRKTPYVVEEESATGAVLPKATERPVTMAEILEPAPKHTARKELPEITETGVTEPLNIPQLNVQGELLARRQKPFIAEPGQAPLTAGRDLAAETLERAEAIARVQPDLTEFRSIRSETSPVQRQMPREFDEFGNIIGGGDITTTRPAPRRKIDLSEDLGLAARREQSTEFEKYGDVFLSIFGDEVRPGKAAPAPKKEAIDLRTRLQQSSEFEKAGNFLAAFGDQIRAGKPVKVTIKDLGIDIRTRSEQAAELAMARGDFLSIFGESISIGRPKPKKLPDTLGVDLLTRNIEDLTSEPRITVRPKKKQSTSSSKPAAEKADKETPSGKQSLIVLEKAETVKKQTGKFKNKTIPLNLAGEAKGELITIKLKDDPVAAPKAKPKAKGKRVEEENALISLAEGVFATGKSLGFGDSTKVVQERITKTGQQPQIKPQDNLVISVNVPGQQEIPKQRPIVSTIPKQPQTTRQDSLLVPRQDQGTGLIPRQIPAFKEAARQTTRTRRTTDGGTGLIRIPGIDVPFPGRTRITTRTTEIPPPSPPPTRVPPSPPLYLGFEGSRRPDKRKDGPTSVLELGTKNPFAAGLSTGKYAKKTDTLSEMLKGGKKKKKGAFQLL